MKTSPAWIFIVNPISGKGKAALIGNYLKEMFDPAGIAYEVVFTKYAGHARELAMEWRDRADYIVAVGGDGTIHETGSALIGASKTCMGIIPCGSGNGLARYLGVPQKMKKAVSFLLEAQPSLMDTGALNGKPFLCVCGFGFDALIAHRFAQAGKRGFATYIKIVRREIFRFSPVEISWSADSAKNKQVQSFMPVVANASQFGNNVFINPLATAFDGKLNLTLIAPFKKKRILFILRAMRKARTHQLVEFTEETAVSFKLSVNTHMAQLDGEPIEIQGVQSLVCVPASLRILSGAHATTPE